MSVFTSICLFLASTLALAQQAHMTREIRNRDAFCRDRAGELIVDHARVVPAEAILNLKWARG